MSIPFIAHLGFLGNSGVRSDPEAALSLLYRVVMSKADDLQARTDAFADLSIKFVQGLPDVSLVRRIAGQGSPGLKMEKSGSAGPSGLAGAEAPALRESSRATADAGGVRLQPEVAGDR
jgi:hypothetical protein